MIPDQPVLGTVLGLAAVAASILILPFLSRKIEENLEPFFLAAGTAALTISGLWSKHVVLEAIKAPIMIGSFPIGIFQIVLVMGLLIHYFNAWFSRWVLKIAKKLGHRLFLFLLIAVLSLLSGIISVVVSAIILIEIAAALPLSKPEKNASSSSPALPPASAHACPLWENRCPRSWLPVRWSTVSCGFLLSVETLRGFDDSRNIGPRDCWGFVDRT